MRNALTIARREITATLTSPIAYVLFGAFAVLFGYFFVEYLQSFIERGMRMGQLGAFGDSTLNVNQDLIRWLFGAASIVVVFLVPFLSMRFVSEELRSGTIELLLTAPVTDGQIVLGKFLAGLALYGAMLAVTLLHLAVLFWYSQPDIAPILAGYLGLVLLGAALLAFGLFVSSLTRHQIVAGLLTFGVLLMLWLLEFAGQRGGDAGRWLAYLSVTGHMEAFGRGVILTRDLVFYLSFVGFWLFLTRESVRARRWRG